MAWKPGAFIVFFLLLNFFGKAQLCSGSLGDPIVNITFGAGANPGAPLSSAATNYKYVTSDCPDDGSYTVRNSTANCFGNTWHTLASDHTGDPNGYFMIVNASYQPSSFYVDTVDVVCSNTTYLFAAWIMNLLKGATCGNIEPNLSFQIEALDGTLLKWYNTGNIAMQSIPTWKEYGFFFTAPPGISRIVVRIINNATGGCGNDLALDDITFRACGPLLTAAASAGSVVQHFCAGEGGQAVLTGNISSDYTSPYIQWQESTDNGATWRDISGADKTSYSKTILPNTPVGSYLYRMAVSKPENRNIATCRVVSNTITVQVHPPPTVTINNPGPVCPGANLILSATGAAQYKWTTNGFSATTPSITLQPTTAGTYYLQATDSYGCTKNDSTNISLKPKPTASVAADTISVCEGSSVELTASGGSSYVWQPSINLSTTTSATTVATPKDSMRYSVVVSNALGCTDTAKVQVNVLRKPTANAGPDKRVVPGQSVQLTGKASGSGITYSWLPRLFISDTSSLQPFVNPPDDLFYQLQVSSVCGMSVDSVKVFLLKKVFVPTAFSPNADGLNDVWEPGGLASYTQYEVQVFDRFGQRVYHGKAGTAFWDGTFKGKRQPTGVYTYLITIKDIDTTLKGWLMLVK